MIPAQRRAAGISIVVDASVVVEILTGQPTRTQLLPILVDSRTSVHAPVLLDHEVLSATRRIELAGRLDPARGAQLLDDLAEFDIERHLLAPLSPSVWSMRTWATIADAYYVSLAKMLEAPLLTTDQRLARTLRDRGAVEVVDLDVD